MAAALVLSAVAWVPAVSAAPTAGVTIAATGTGTEDHFNPGTREPGDDLGPNDSFVRTLDATTVDLSYTPDPGGSTNLVLTAVISTARAGWDLRSTNFGSGPGAPCPGGVTTPNRWTLRCAVGTVSGSQTHTFTPAMRISALAGDNFAFHVTVTVTDANTPLGVAAVSPDVFSSAAPRFDLEKTIQNSVQTASTFEAEGVYALKVGDTDPLGISALPDPVTFVDHVDVHTRIDRCDDTTPLTDDTPPVDNPDGQIMQIVGTCNGAGFGAPTGLANGQSVPVSMANVDWDRIYPPPTMGNNLSNASSGWAIATMQFWMETDKTDVEAGDGIVGNGAGNLTVGDAIGMTGYDSNTDAGVGPAVWSPADTQGHPNLGSDDTPGLDPGDLADNTATQPYNISLNALQGKYISELTVDGQHVVTEVTARDASQGVSWPDEIDLCDKFDNRREQLMQAPGSTTGDAVVNATAPNHPVFAGATIQYARSAGWGPGAGPTSTQWWNMSQSGCAAADVVGGQFYTSSQIDWGNNNTPGLINVEDINVVRYLPAGPFLNPSGSTGTYSLNVHFRVSDNQTGDYIVDYSSADFDGPGAGGWESSSCNGGTPGACPDPPVLIQNNAFYRPGPVSSGVMIHMDSHPTIAKHVVDPPSANGTTPIAFTYELRLGNTQIPNDHAVRQDITVTDVLPPQLDYLPGTYNLVSNPAGLSVSQPSYNAQTHTLTWTISGLRLDIPSSDMPVLQYQALAGPYTPSSGSAGYINRATLGGPGILSSLNTPWSPSSTITPEQFAALGTPAGSGLMHSDWGLFAEAKVEVVGASGVLIDKTVSQTESEPGDTFSYSLVYGNLGGDVERMDAYDILPFAGDPRQSGMHGTLELLGVTEDPASDVEVWISDLPPATLDALDDGLPSGTGLPVPGGINPTWPNLPATGSATWPCQIQDAGQPGCPALSTVTAIRVVGLDPNPAATGGVDSFLPAGSNGPYSIDLSVRSVDGRGGDHFHNNWAAHFAPLGNPATALAVAHTLMEGAIGDRVFDDRNRNGRFDVGDRGIEHVEVRVFDQSNVVVGTAQTDADGRWIVDHLHPGDYRVRIPSTEFDSGGTLERYEVVGVGAAADPDTDADEATDHDAHPVANGVEAGGDLTIAYGTEPLLDDLGGITFLRDEDANLTVDFALAQIPQPPPPPPPPPPSTTTTTTPARRTTPPPTQAQVPQGSLPRTGWESLLWIVVGGSLVLGGAIFISRRQDQRA